MKIIHNISLRITPKIKKKLEGFGIFVSGGFGKIVGEDLVNFKVSESDECWKELESRLANWQAIDISFTKFSIKELKEANWLFMVPDWHHGYPQPEDDFGYLMVTYDLTNNCEKCGIGPAQNAPFRIKKEPGWGKRGILQLNWVFDEFFAKPDVWQNVFKPFEVSYRSVLHYKSLKELKTVVQLLIDEEIEIELDGYDYDICEMCKCKKYLPITRGKFPPLKSLPNKHISRTKNYFGSGASAFREIIISQYLFKKISEQNIKGVSFEVVA
ncbi:MAG: hypothetical protein KAW12_21510 [Candidatus Aminicenantes bacterium]|nr:hypothetical protein [Candidatus Aminicenantes bacterium]